MRILLINPNTSVSVTALVADHVRRHLRDAGDEPVELVPVTARFGAAYIASRAALAIAGHAALDALAEHVEGCDAAYLACFGDPGLAALREISPVPVTGMVEASVEAAAQRASRFAIVTGGAAWRPMLEEIVAGLGHAPGLVAVRTVAPTGGEIARDPESALAGLVAACRACAEEDGAGAVILGGAALAGLAERIQPDVPVPVLCSVAAGANAVLSAARAPQRTPSFDPTASTGLGAPLADRLAGA